MIMTPGLCADMTPPDMETWQGGEAHCEAEDAVEQLHRQMTCSFFRLLKNVTLSKAEKILCFYFI